MAVRRRRAMVKINDANQATTPPSNHKKTTSINEYR
jgi:hypothetical protein